MPVVANENKLPEAVMAVEARIMLPNFKNFQLTKFFAEMVTRSVTTQPFEGSEKYRVMQKPRACTELKNSISPLFSRANYFHDTAATMMSSFLSADIIIC